MAGMDRDNLEAGFRLVLEGLGLDLSNPHLRDTPRRTADAWYEEICAGLREEELTLDTFPAEEGAQHGLVALNRIPVKSLCAHHLLPLQGRATVADLPAGELCGLSNLSRVVNHFARRPQMQEHLTHQTAHFLEAHLRPLGVGVIVQAAHACMELRGVNHAGLMTTTAWLGAFREDESLRAELVALTAQGPGAEPG